MSPIEFVQDLTQHQSQRLILSQQQILSLQMLELDLQELSSLLQEEFNNNPTLEWDTTVSDRSTGYQPPERPAPEGRSELYSDEEIWKNHVIDQLRANHYSKTQWACFLTLLRWVDDNGFFTTPIEEFAAETGYPQETAKKCLNILQSLEPAGIFASGVRESLLLQARRQGVLDSALEGIILSHLDLVAAGRFDRIAELLGVSKAQVRNAVTQLRQLTPYPLNGSVGTPSQYIVPDVILHREDEKWHITLNDFGAFSYTVSPYYSALLRSDQPPEVQAYLKESLARTNAILSGLKKRQETILSIMQALVVQQEPWLDCRGSLQPITMTELSAQLKLNPSTVSRAVKNKYVQTSTRGTIPLKDFFSQEVSGGTNAEQIKERIRSLIAQEPPHKPHSDQKLVRLLELEGITLARRTVAKYRESMLIPSASARKTR